MFLNVLRFVRLPLLMIAIFATGRFLLGFYNVPYAPRGNATFSIVGLMFVSSAYFGAMSKKVADLNWLGTFLTGFVIAEFGEILIWIATLVSLLAQIKTSYFLHWDSLNLKEGAEVTMANAMIPRTVALVTAPIFSGVMACIGRAVFAPLAPTPKR
jgi:hypothetical protein